MANRVKYRYYEKVDVPGWYEVIQDDGEKSWGEYSVKDSPDFQGQYHALICACYGNGAKEHAEQICKALNEKSL